MARYRPYVEAVQWTGTNVIEIRQFVNANTGVIDTAVIRDGVLYVETELGQTQLLGMQPIPVPVGNWLVRNGDQMASLTPQEFEQRYTPEPTVTPMVTR